MIETLSPSERAEERLWDILYENRDDRLVYVYDVDENNKIIKPHFLKWSASRDLMETIREKHGGGTFRVMIREGRKLIFSGIIAIASLPEARQHRK